MLGLTLWRGYVEFFLLSYAASLTFLTIFPFLSYDRYYYLLVR